MTEQEAKDRHSIQAFGKVDVRQKFRFGPEGDRDSAIGTDPVVMNVSESHWLEDQQLWQFFFRPFREGHCSFTFLNGFQ